MKIASTTDANALVCHQCGYDLRAHPLDGICPECAASVCESKRIAAIPRRPAWKDSDVRWRRRILFGLWILVLMPLWDLMHLAGWAALITVPTIFGVRNAPVTLEDAFLSRWPVYPSLTFCMGTVLLFSKERGRRRGRFDGLRWWGIFFDYIVLLLCFAPLLYITALVMAGCAAAFMSMPLKYQPGFTRFFIEVSSNWLRYGPNPHMITVSIRALFSTAVVLMACVPLFNALRSTSLKRSVFFWLSPLVFFGLLNAEKIAQNLMVFSSASDLEINDYAVYFRPGTLISGIVDLINWVRPTSTFGVGDIETLKWGVIASIAFWLSFAQFKAWVGGRKIHRRPER